MCGKDLKIVSKVEVTLICSGGMAKASLNGEDNNVENETTPPHEPKVKCEDFLIDRSRAKEEQNRIDTARKKMRHSGNSLTAMRQRNAALYRCDKTLLFSSRSGGCDSDIAKETFSISQEETLE